MHVWKIQCDEVTSIIELKINSHKAKFSIKIKYIGLLDRLFFFEMGLIYWRCSRPISNVVGKFQYTNETKKSRWRLLSLLSLACLIGWCLPHVWIVCYFSQIQTFSRLYIFSYPYRSLKNANNMLNNISLRFI